MLPLKIDSMRIFDKLFGKPSLAGFAAELIQALQDAGDTDELRHDPAEHRILRLHDGKVAGVVNLNNLYRTYRRQPRARRPEYLRSVARGVLTHLKKLPDEFDAASPDLRPRLWPRVALEQERLRGRLDDEDGGLPALPGESVGEHLIACLAYDWPESVRSIGDEDLRRWGVTFYEAREVAKRNLEEATPGHARLGENLHTFITGDSYDAARLTLVERIQDLETAGKPVAMVPNRNSLLITGSDDEVGLAIMARLASQAIEEPYALSGVPLILDDGAWLDGMPPDDHPSLRQFKQVETNWLGPLYFEQKKLLDAVHERQGIDVYVANFSAVQKNDGDVVSYCVWGQGIDSLLPVTEKVAFMQQGRDRPVALADWARVMEVVGDLMEPTEDYPRRYRVREFPGGAALDAIGVGEMEARDPGSGIL